ncbi:MAG: type V CRISPR-associated endonuclease Cas1 [Anaerovoracaceae bacterium]|jgi:CRISPR-associated protein Cas1
MISEHDFKFKQIVFLFASNGEKLSFSNDNIVVKDANGKIIHQSTCYRLFLLFVIGDITITSGLIKRAKRFGFTICLMTTTMRVYQIIGAGMEGNTLLHQKQYSYDKLDLGIRLIQNKLLNQRAVLSSIRNKTEHDKILIKSIDEHIHKLSEGIDSLSFLLGLEGSVARMYFSRLFDVPEWKGRKPRIKSDYINSTLDIGYTIMSQIIEALLRVYGFDVYVGVLHRSFYMRKSLVCDILEPCRPLIDKCVRKAIHLGQCKIEDFEVQNGQYRLAWKNSPAYISFIINSIMPYKNDLFIYIRDYYRAFMRGKRAEEFPLFCI